MQRLIRLFGWKLMFFPIMLSIMLFLGAALLITSSGETKTTGPKAQTTEKAADRTEKKEEAKTAEKQEAKTEKAKEKNTEEKKTEAPQADTGTGTSEEKAEEPGQEKETQEEKQEEKKKDPKDQGLPNAFEPGTYVAGKDIEPGEYLLTETNGGSPFVEIKDDKEHISVSMAFHNRTYLTIEKGMTVSLRDANAVISTNSVSYQLEGTYYPEGQYLAGKDLPEGTYVLRPNKDSEEGSYSVSEDSSGTLSSINQSEIITEEKEVAIKKDTYILLTGLEMRMAD